MEEKRKIKETDLIKYIEGLSRKTLEFNKRLIIKPIGDDCAIFKDGASMLASSDSITENVHFDTDSYSYYEIGRKALLVNISDIAAMGGTPRMLLLSLFIPPYSSFPSLKRLVRGVADASAENRVSIIGGNISKSPALSVCVTIIGDYEGGNAVERRKSCPGDEIYVSGELGNAWMAYYLNANKNEICRKTAGLKKTDRLAVERFARLRKLPEPRVELGKKLSAAAGGPAASSMTDISDGLFKDLWNLVPDGCGFEIDLDEIPVGREAKYISEMLSIGDLDDYAVSFGEDYELLWSAPPGRESFFSAVSKKTGVGIKKIGRVTEKPSGRFLKNGKRRRVKDYSFKHL